MCRTINHKLSEHERKLNNPSQYEFHRLPHLLNGFKAIQIWNTVTPAKTVGTTCSAFAPSVEAVALNDPPIAFSQRESLVPRTCIASGNGRRPGMFMVLANKTRILFQSLLFSNRLPIARLVLLQRPLGGDAQMRSFRTTDSTLKATINCLNKPLSGGRLSFDFAVRLQLSR
jgi:hypothetical protein